MLSCVTHVFVFSNRQTAVLAGPARRRTGTSGLVPPRSFWCIQMSYWLAAVDKRAPGEPAPAYSLAGGATSLR